MVDLTEKGNYEMTTILEKIEKHFKAGKTLTAPQCQKLFGTLRLGAFVFTLRQRGLNIESKFIDLNGKNYKLYWLEK